MYYIFRYFHNILYTFTILYFSIFSQYFVLSQYKIFRFFHNILYFHNIIYFDIFTILYFFDLTHSGVDNHYYLLRIMIDSRYVPECGISYATCHSLYSNTVLYVLPLYGITRQSLHFEMSVHSEARNYELRSLELMLLKSRTKGQFSVGCTMCEVTMRKLKEFLMNDESAQVTSCL